MESRLSAVPRGSAFRATVANATHSAEPRRHFRRGVLGGVHDVVEPDDALLALAGERDGDLAVVNRGRGKNGGDRHHAGGDVEMELVAIPGSGEAATVALATRVAADR